MARKRSTIDIGLDAICRRDLSALRTAVLAYLSEHDNPVPDGMHRNHLRNHLRELVGAPAARPLGRRLP